MPRQKRPAVQLKGYLSKQASKSPVISCPDRENCNGECAVATIATERLISRENRGVMVVCTTCWRHRFVGSTTADRMRTTKLPPQLRIKIQRDDQWRSVVEMAS